MQNVGVIRLSYTRYWLSGDYGEIIRKLSAIILHLILSSDKDRPYSSVAFGQKSFAL